MGASPGLRPRLTYGATAVKPGPLLGWALKGDTDIDPHPSMRQNGLGSCRGGGGGGGWERVGKGYFRWGGAFFYLLRCFWHLVDAQ